MYRELPKFKADEILVYLRRSRSDDPALTVEEVLQQHEDLLNEWIERNLDEPVPECNWYREVVSGETISDRKEFQKVLKRLEEPTTKAVLVVECSRLSRGDLEDCGRIMKLFRYTDTYVITRQRVYDLRDKHDREGFEREIQHGNYYLEYCRDIMRRGLDYAIANGAFTKSMPPYGYRKNRVPFGKKKLPSLEIYEEEAQVVRMIFDWYANEGLGSLLIAERLDSMGIKPRKAAHWGGASILKILENEHYIGKIRYQAHKTVHIVENQEIIKKKVYVKDYQLFDGIHEPIISEELFYKAKSRRDALPRVQKEKKLRNPLATLLYCDCGHAMVYAIKRGVPRFECTVDRWCNSSSINANQLLNAIYDVLERELDEVTVEMNGSNDELIKKHQEKIAFLEKKLKDAENKELALWEKYTEEGMPKSVFENLRSKYEAEKEKIENALNDAISTMPQEVDYEHKIYTLSNALKCLRDDDVSVEAKNKLLKACIERIDYSRKGAVRGNREDLKEGQTYERGWIQSEPKINVRLKL